MTSSHHDPGIRAAQASAVDSLRATGDWLTGEQRSEAWRHVRDADTNELDAARRSAVSPFAIADRHDATPLLPAAAIEVAHRVASDPGRLTHTWADQQIAELGEEIYTELVGVTAIASVIDRFHDAMGDRRPDIASGSVEAPECGRPADVGDVGAWVAQTLGDTTANVSRTLSLVPRTNEPWRQLVTTHYSRGQEFMNQVWDRPLSRPQVELVASRTTAWNECFY